ncbi:AAA family ATPase [Scytonema sp. UIC 10036]|uniref:nSTAND1 domain-containing NTPase n=1 Tax=Scytonema sp. UIC 10036 TaxID=2304196 RepID=UPI001FA9936C|nr:AAA family ATPase [Scytonema sp. UIC 10036]
MIIRLESRDYNSLIELLVNIPELETERGRRVILESAGLFDFTNRINFSGDTKTVVSQIVSYLCNHGRVNEAQTALELFLITIKNVTGYDQRAFIDKLLDKYKPRLKGLEISVTSFDASEVRTDYSNANPFVPLVGRVEDARHFFGRKREIQRVFEVLESGSSVALIGEEGIGKSSLLWAICQQAETLLQSPRQPIFLDLNEIGNESDFYIALCDRLDLRKSKGYELARSLRKHPKKVLLAIDNVAKFTWKGFTRQVRDQLRALAEGNDAPLRLILAASEPLDNLFNDSHDEVKTSPLAGICQEEQIKRWNETTMRVFITNRLAGTSVSFSEETITQLMQQSGGLPKRLMQLCYRAFAQYVGGGVS